MSLKYRNSTGTETPVAGLNGTSGELVPSVALYQRGTVSVPLLNVQADTAIQVTFNTPMPDADYEVSTEESGNSWGRTISIVGKTTSGFSMRFLNCSGSIMTASTVNWTAFKLMTDEVHEADASAIAQNTANFAPAFSETTSYAVGDYCTYNGILYRCTTAHTAGVWVAGHFTQVTVGGTLSDIVPSDASNSNKLVTQNNLPKTKTGILSSGSTGTNSIDVEAFSGGCLVIFNGSNYGSGAFIVTNGWSAGGYVTKLSGSTVIDVEIKSVASAVPTLTLKTVNMTASQSVSYTIKQL